MQARAPLHGYRLGLAISLAGHGAVLALAASLHAGPPGGGGGGGGGLGTASAAFELRLAPGPEARGAEASGADWVAGTLDPRREPALPPPSEPEPEPEPEPLAWLGAIPPPAPVEEPAPEEPPEAPAATAADAAPAAEAELASSGAASEAEPSAPAPLAGGVPGEGGSMGGSSSPPREEPPGGGSPGGVAAAGDAPAGDPSGRAGSSEAPAGPPGEDGHPGSGGPGPARTPPVLVRSGTLAYPQAAWRLGHEGRVLLRIEISAGGEVLDVEVLESSGHALLDQAAQAAVRAWDYRPATERGVPVRGSLLHRITFRLEDAT